MDAAELVRVRDEIVASHGPWLAHNIHLGHGVYTIGPPDSGTVGGNSEGRLRRIVQLCADLASPLDQLRIADLGSGEGNIALEFAARGARVMAIDGRADNLEKMRFAKTALGRSQERRTTESSCGICESEKYSRRLKAIVE